MTGGRTPPHDELAERGVLGLAISLGRIPEAAASLVPGDFYRPENEVIWTAMTSLTKAGKPCDIFAVQAHLQERGKLNCPGGMPDLYLIELLETTPVADPAYVAEIVAERSRRRQLIRLFESGLQRAYESADDVDTQLERTVEELRRIPAQNGLRAAAIMTRPGIYTREALDQLPPREDLITGLLPRRGLVLLAAWRGSAKSFLAIDMAATVAAGLPTFWGRKVTASGPVIYVAHEGTDGIKARLAAWEQANGARAGDILWWTAPLDLTDDGMRAELELVARHLNAVGIVLDPARTTGFKSEDSRDAAAYALALGRLQRAVGGVVTVLQNSGYDRSRERGSTMLGDACDAVFNITKEPAGVRKLTAGRQRETATDDDEALMVFTVEPVPGTGSAVLVAAEDERERAISRLRDRIFNLVEADPGMPTKTIADLLDLDPSNTSTHLKALAHEGRVENRGNKSRASWHPCDPSQALA